MLSIIEKNIKIKIISFLFLGSAIIAALFSLYNYNITKEHLVKKLENAADEHVNRISQNLIIPLWEIDSDWITKTIDTELVEEELVAVSVSGEGGVYVARKQDSSKQIQSFTSFSNEEGIFLERIRPIVHNNEEIGNVTIYFTREVLDKRLLDEARKIVTVVVVLVLFSIISLYLILDYFILHPLGKILTIVNNTSKNDYTKEIEITQEDEIGRLAKGFNEMIHNILDKEELMIS